MDAVAYACDCHVKTLINAIGLAPQDFLRGSHKMYASLYSVAANWVNQVRSGDVI